MALLSLPRRKRDRILLTVAVSIAAFVAYMMAFTIMTLKIENNQEVPLGSGSTLIRSVNADVNFTPVVIVAYMRSGSTFLGNIVQHDPGVFYVFEPLRQIEKKFLSSMKKVFGTVLQFQNRRPSMMTRQASLNIYRAWFTCDIPAIVSSPHRHFLVFFKYGHKTKELLHCLDNISNSSNVSNDMCTMELQTRCLESKVRVFKTVRTPMDWLYDLMLEFPNMKIIHLVRDPRAIANSLVLFEDCFKPGNERAYYKCIQFFCAKMEDDLTPYDMYKELFPERMMRVVYEDLALEPVVMSEKIYGHLGMSLSNRTKEYIYNITMAGNSPSHVLDTVRANSKQGIYTWRSKLEDLNIVQSLCKYAMTKLHYPHFTRP